MSNITVTVPGTAVQITGTPNEVLETMKKLGVEMNTSEFYFSSKLGLLKIEDMNTSHLRNALIKLYKDVLLEEARKAPTNKGFVDLLTSPPTHNRTVMKMLFTLSKREDV